MPACWFLTAQNTLSAYQRVKWALSFEQQLQRWVPCQSQHTDQLSVRAVPANTLRLVWLHVEDVMWMQSNGLALPSLVWTVWEITCYLCRKAMSHTQTGGTVNMCACYSNVYNSRGHSNYRGCQHTSQSLRPCPTKRLPLSICTGFGLLWLAEKWNELKAFFDVWSSDLTKSTKLNPQFAVWLQLMNYLSKLIVSKIRNIYCVGRLSFYQFKFWWKDRVCSATNLNHRAKPQFILSGVEASEVRRSGSMNHNTSKINLRMFTSCKLILTWGRCCNACTVSKTDVSFWGYCCNSHNVRLHCALCFIFYLKPCPIVCFAAHATYPSTAVSYSPTCFQFRSCNTKNNTSTKAAGLSLDVPSSLHKIKQATNDLINLTRARLFHCAAAE